ncbi:MAG: hypothetical protein F9K44_08770 [Hyphomicrobiaceae bacterium]|nr:MAG: hypothetical protein F9K44_08770 [Hyphomicrobiaceae bacterium]
MWRTNRPVLDAGLRQSLAACRARWEARCVSTAPADRAETEKGVRHAYRAAGLQAPDVVWCNGPRELAEARSEPAAVKTVGPLVNVVDRVRSSVDPSVLNIVRREQMSAISAGMGHFPTGRLVIEAMTDVVPWSPGGRTSKRWPRLVNRLKVLKPPNWARAPLVHFGFGQHAGARLALYEFLLDNFGLERQLEPLRGLVAIARSCGWVMPHENVCFAVERHDTLKIDAVIGKLHAASGPAIRYADGWERYFWKGVRVRRRLVEQPQGITLRRIDAEPDPVTRHCMIDIMTPEKFIASGAATKVAIDETGTLWRRSWGVMGAWAAVEVVNGSPEPNGTYRHYFLTVPPTVRSARQGVAWTYGLAEHEYRSLRHRT